jgi:hypothetical protein
MEAASVKPVLHVGAIPLQRQPTHRAVTESRHGYSWGTQPFVDMASVNPLLKTTSSSHQG